MNFKLRIEAPNSDAVLISVSLTDASVALLKRFRDYAEDLRRCKWVADGCPVKLDFAYRAGHGVSASPELPPWDDIIVFLHTIRPLHLQSEPTFYRTVSNIVGRVIENDKLRVALSAAAATFGGGSFRSMMVLTSNGVVLNSEETLNNWLNAYEYHRDQDKKQAIDELHRMFPLDASKVYFLILLSERTKAILWLSSLVALLLGSSEHLDLGVAEGAKRRAD